MTEAEKAYQYFVIAVPENEEQAKAYFWARKALQPTLTPPNEWVRPVTITHGDAIRAMDDRALALWMLGLIEETDVPRYCRLLPECDRDLGEDREIPLERCRECLALWLGQVEGGGQDGQQTG